MKIQKKITNKRKTVLVKFTVVAILTLLIGAYTLTRSATQQKSKGAPTITSTPTVPIENSKRQDTVSPNNQDTGTISITVSNSSQDETGGPLIIRSVVQTNNTATCTYILSKNGITKRYESNIVFTGTYYGCNYDVPYSDLSTGVWDLTINIKQGDKYGNVTLKATIES